MSEEPKIPDRLGPMRLRDKWQYIAEDLSLMMLKDAEGLNPLVSVEDICSQYNMSQEELTVLLRYKPFQNLVAEYGKRNAALGDNASLVLRMQTMGSVLAEELFKDVQQSGTELAQKIRVWESFMKYGGLDPATNGSGKTKAGGGDGGNAAAAVAQVIIKIDSRIPGLEHCQPKAVGADVVEPKDG